MIIKNTVFILGAGASRHYGYPTGEELITKVMHMASRLAQYCRNRLNSGQTAQIMPTYVSEKYDAALGVQGAQRGWAAVRDECEALVARLKIVRPLVIDYFLAWNESLGPIGKLIIAAVILECESDTSQPLHNQDWYRFLVHNSYPVAANLPIFSKTMCIL
jgi:hypothetical protein